MHDFYRKCMSIKKQCFYYNAITANVKYKFLQKEGVVDMTERYSRQQLFTPIGHDGQHTLRKKHVLVVGAGALGSAVSEALVRAGIGKLTIVDRDYVEFSNLQRQQLYTERDAQDKMPKAMAAQARLTDINQDVEIDARIADADVAMLTDLAQHIDLMIDGTDNFDTRFMMNDIAQKYNIPWIYGSCVGSYGATYTILPGETPCLHCLLNAVPNTGMTCDTAGIISPAVQITAAYEVAEALKLLTNNTAALRGTFLTFDVWQNSHFEMKIGAAKNPACPCCGEAPIYPHLSYDNQTKTAVLCGRDAVQIRPATARDYDLPQLAKTLSVHGDVQVNPFLLSCQLEQQRLVIFKDGRVLIHGTHDVQYAKNLYYRLLG